MNSITDWLSRSSGTAVYAIVGALVFCEDALFFGFVLPGETAAVLGGVVASQGRVSVFWLCVVVVLAAVAGDSVGYEVGKRLGPRILETRALRGHRERIGHAEELIRRRGPAAVFLGRFIAFFRALMPALAGISRMPYRVFLAFNAAGGLIWGSASRCSATTPATPTSGSSTPRARPSRSSSRWSWSRPSSTGTSGAGGRRRGGAGGAGAGGGGRAVGPGQRNRRDRPDRSGGRRDRAGGRRRVHPGR